MESEAITGREPPRDDASPAERSDAGNCAVCGTSADGFDARVGSAICSACASEPVVRTDGGISRRRPRLAGLTAFRRDILWVLEHNGAMKGVAVQEKLEEYYGENVSYGQLYPNLDRLVDEGYVEKGERDHRTNEYALTADAERALSRRRRWTETAEVFEV